MAIKLTDDGTLDTVLRCDECGEEFRYNYDPASDGYPAEDAAKDAYDDFIDGCIEDATAEHVCDTDDDSPQDDDITTEDHRRFYQYGKVVIEPYDKRDDDPRTWLMWIGSQRKQIVVRAADCNAAVRQFMERSQFWPNCWFISDHGNAHLIDLSEQAARR